MIETLTVGELVIDDNIQPRGINFTHLDAVKNALLSGAAFPPIIAERTTLRIVDGRHRHRAYSELYGAEHEVQVELCDYANENALYLEAVEANNSHGLGYTPYDRRRILVEAAKRGIAREAIANAMRMPVDKAERKAVDGTAYRRTPAGVEPVALRTPLKPLAGRTLNKRQEEANKKAGMRAEFLCTALVKLLRAGLLTWGSKSAVHACRALHKELEKQVAA